MDSMFSFWNEGNQLAVRVATSLKNNGQFRYREYKHYGGDGFGVRGSEAHIGKIDKLIEGLKTGGDTSWKCVHFLAMYKPKHYYAHITNGHIGINYLYTTTDAPGSGLGAMFCPEFHRTQIKGSDIDPRLIGVIIGNNIDIDYLNLTWEDRKTLYSLIDNGISADVISATFKIMM